MSTTHITQLPSCLTSLLCTVGQNVFWSYIIILKYPGTCLKNFVVPQECNLKADAQNWAAQNWQNLRFSKIFLSYWTTILTFKCDFERFFPFYVWPARPCVQLDTTLLAPTVDQKWVQKWFTLFTSNEGELCKGG